jgi:hypothetical protein
LLYQFSAQVGQGKFVAENTEIGYAANGGILKEDF